MKSLTRRMANQRWKVDPKAIRALPPVFGQAVIEEHGVSSTRGVALFEKLPGWWAKATYDQRQLWLTEFFRRGLNLTDSQRLVSVTVGGRLQ
jgi:hypothetical protein